MTRKNARTVKTIEVLWYFATVSAEDVANWIFEDLKVWDPRLASTWNRCSTFGGTVTSTLSAFGPRLEVRFICKIVDKCEKLTDPVPLSMTTFAPHLSGKVFTHLPVPQTQIVHAAGLRNGILPVNSNSIYTDLCDLRITDERIFETNILTRRALSRDGEPKVHMPF